jgi:hypothetical protein
MLLLEVPNCGRDCSVTQGYITFADTAAPQLSLGVIKLTVLLAVTPGRRDLGITMDVLRVRSEQPFVIAVSHSVGGLSLHWH